MMQAPSIPVQFARPIPTISTQSPADVLNRPGPYGAQPQSAPRIGGPSTLPPGAAIPAAGSVVAGSGSSILLPAAALALPLAIGAGETGNPILSTAREMEAIRRADRARGQERNSTDRPGKGNQNQADPTNPNGGAGRPNTNSRPRPPVAPGATYDISYYIQKTGSNPFTDPVQVQVVTGPFNGVEVRSRPDGAPVKLIGFNTGGGFITIVEVGNDGAPFWSVNITAIQRRDLPPPPANPGSGSVPTGTMVPVLTAPPNPAKRLPPPNPTNPNPTNPTNPTQPTNPNPVNPSPTSPGPLVPVSPGPLVPVSPGPLVPRSPIPNGPNNPKRDPCGDPCIDTALSRTEPVVIQVKQFVSCSRAVFGIPAPFNTVPVTVPRLFAPAFQLVLDNQAELLKQISCNPPEPSIAAIPDWWQIRLGANRPQLLILYARKFNDGTWDKPKYVLSIPHWNKSKIETVFSDFPTYDKGDFQGTRVLPDNSKLIVNALTSDEARRVIAKLSAGIPADMIEFAQTSIADRRGAPLRKITVYPRIVRYFATGQKDLAPTWSIDFR